MDQELRAVLDEIKTEVVQLREELAQHRSETATEFQTVKTQLNEVERLARFMTENLLSPHEQRELKRKTG